jgi:hypothetical protein
MKVLIVEDRFDNAVTAMQFFSSKGIETVVVGDAEMAIEKLQEEVFLAAILDVEIPQRKGGKPEKLGPKVGKIAKKLGTSYVYLTGGYFHHGPQAKVFLDELCLEKDEGDLVPDKTNSLAWAKAWETLQSMGNLQAIYDTQVRYKKYTGKNYERRKR